LASSSPDAKPYATCTFATFTFAAKPIAKPMPWWFYGGVQNCLCSAVRVRL
jgi:hypothetical protein